MADRTYEVLYYKRASANKVHRQRGVATMDGILSINGERVTLQDTGDNEDQCSTSDNEQATKNWKKNRGKSNVSSFVYSGTQREIAKRTLNVDDTIVLGGYEVQISSILSTNDGNAAAVSQPNAQKKQSIVKKRPISQSILGKRKVAPVGLKSRAMTMPRVATTQQAKRVAPLQPIKSNPSLCRTQVESRPPKPEVSTSFPNSSVNSAQVLPHIPLAASIRAVLRPHQVTGVDFLWKTLHEKKGCILGDEMGLGVRAILRMALHSLMGLDLENTHDNCNIDGIASAAEAQGT